MEERQPQRLTRGDVLLAACLGVVGAVAAAATSPLYGMSWDEGYYHPTFVDVWEWVKLLLSSPSLALSGDGVRLGWESINELPPLTKWLGALCVALTPEGLEGGELHASRAFAFVLFGATVALLYAAARPKTSLPFALGAALLYAMHPRVFGHAHFAASETVFAFVAVLALWTAQGDVTRWPRRLLLAAVCGLAVATKVNGLILSAAVCGWLVVRPWLGTVDERKGLRPHLVTIAVVVVGAPLLAWLLWPWMWRETITRIADYWIFIRDHSHQGVWYLGAKFNAPVVPGGPYEYAPWHYPLVMLVATTPPLTLLAALAGLFWTLWRGVTERGRLPAVDVLALLLVVGPLTAAMLPNAPKYDGARLFFPALAPLIFLASRLDVFADAPDEQPRWWPRARFVIPGLLVLAAIPSIATHGGRGLQYYSEAVRLAVPRGGDFPFEAAYWQEAVTPAVVQDIIDLAGTETVNVKTLALHDVVFDIQRGWGRLPEGFVTGGAPPYDYHLLQNRRGFWMRSEWSIHLQREPLMTWPEGAREPALYLYDGAPPLPLPPGVIESLQPTQ